MRQKQNDLFFFFFCVFDRVAAKERVKELGLTGDEYTRLAETKYLTLPPLSETKYLTHPPLSDDVQLFLTFCIDFSMLSSSSSSSSSLLARLPRGLSTW
jgi:hypothetical protein